MMTDHVDDKDTRTIRIDREPQIKIVRLCDLTDETIDKIADAIVRKIMARELEGAE